MEELIEIIIRLIGGLMAPKPPPRQTQSGRPPMLQSTPQTPSGHGGAAYKPIPGARPAPPSRANVTTKAPKARRRPQPPPLMAAPILLKQSDEASQAPVVTRTQAAKSMVPSQNAKAPGALDAAAFRRWLTPATLRQQFLLTEIFQPPLTLREPRDASQRL